MVMVMVMVEDLVLVLGEGERQFLGPGALYLGTRYCL